MMCIPYAWKEERRRFCLQSLHHAFVHIYIQIAYCIQENTVSEEATAVMNGDHVSICNVIVQ